MYINLRKVYRELDKNEKIDLRSKMSKNNSVKVNAEIMSKKISGTYGRSKNKAKVNFTENEKKAIIDYFREIKNVEYSYDWLFENIDNEKNEIFINTLCEKNAMKYSAKAIRLRLAIKRAKKFYGTTEQEIIDKMEISKNTLTNYKNGKSEMKDKQIYKIAKILNVDIDYLTGKHIFTGEYYDSINQKEHLRYVNDLENMIKRTIKEYISIKYDFKSSNEEQAFYKAYEKDFPEYFRYLITEILAGFHYDDFFTKDYAKAREERLDKMFDTSLDNEIYMEGLVTEKIELMYPHLDENELQEMYALENKKREKEIEFMMKNYSEFEKAIIYGKVNMSKADFDRLKEEEKKALYEEQEKMFLL